jgi:hypothetical protein
VQNLKAWSGQMWVYHAGGCSGVVEPAIIRRQLIQFCSGGKLSRSRKILEYRRVYGFLQKDTLG